MLRSSVGGLAVWEPQTRRERARGLLGRDGLAPDEALLLRRCRSVHTFGMRFAIEVVLLDRDMQPFDVISMKPGRVLRPRRRVSHVLEVAAGCGRRLAQEIHDPVPGAVPADTQPSTFGSKT
ncbi:MAG: DUF192 domain-containing protein [Actinomycetota bacterium]